MTTFCAIWGCFVAFGAHVRFDLGHFIRFGVLQSLQAWRAYLST